MLVLAIFLACVLAAFGTRIFYVATFDCDTVFSKQYTELAFCRVRVGTSADQVQHLLGEPLFVQDYINGQKLWFYSKPGGNAGHYQVKAVVMSSNSIVTRKMSFLDD